jgi:predicted RNase H-like HicB family nuclease
MRRYTVVLTPELDGDGYSVVVPALPGCFTEGDTVEEALEMAKDAIVPYLEGDPAAEWPAPAGVIVAEVDVPIEEADGVLRPMAAARA